VLDAARIHVTLGMHEFLVIRTVADLVNMHAVPAGRERALVEHDPQHDAMRALLHIDRADFLTLVAEHFGGPFLGARGAGQKATENRIMASFWNMRSSLTGYTAGMTSNPMPAMSLHQVRRGAQSSATLQRDCEIARKP
jgi:hypothetical protein